MTVDPVLVFALGFTLILCIMAKFTGICKSSCEKDEETNENDSNETEEFSASIPTVNVVMDNSISEISVDVPTETMVENTEVTADNVIEEKQEEIPVIIDDVDDADRPSTINELLALTIEPDESNVLYHTLIKLDTIKTLNFKGKHEDVFDVTDTVLISLRSKKQ